MSLELNERRESFALLHQPHPSARLYGNRSLFNAKQTRNSVLAWRNDRDDDTWHCSFPTQIHMLHVRVFLDGHTGRRINVNRLARSFQKQVLRA